MAREIPWYEKSLQAGGIASVFDNLPDWEPDDDRSALMMSYQPGDIERAGGVVSDEPGVGYVGSKSQYIPEPTEARSALMMGYRPGLIEQAGGVVSGEPGIGYVGGRKRTELSPSEKLAAFYKNRPSTPSMGDDQFPGGDFGDDPLFNYSDEDVIGVYPHERALADDSYFAGDAGLRQVGMTAGQQENRRIAARAKAAGEVRKFSDRPMPGYEDITQEDWYTPPQEREAAEKGVPVEEEKKKSYWDQLEENVLRNPEKEADTVMTQYMDQFIRETLGGMAFDSLDPFQQQQFMGLVQEWRKNLIKEKTADIQRENARLKLIGEKRKAEKKGVDDLRETSLNLLEAKRKEIDYLNETLDNAPEFAVNSMGLRPDEAGYKRAKTKGLRDIEEQFGSTRKILESGGIGMKRKKDDSLRSDGTEKGPGFLGTLQRPDGKVSTELSIGVSFDGKEMEIPTLVPTLTKEEINFLLNAGEGTKLPQSIKKKAVEHAKKRIKQGLSPFKEGTLGKEKLSDRIAMFSKEERNMAYAQALKDLKLTHKKSLFDFSPKEQSAIPQKVLEVLENMREEVGVTPSLGAL